AHVGAVTGTQLQETEHIQLHTQRGVLGCVFEGNRIVFDQVNVQRDAGPVTVISHTGTELWVQFNFATFNGVDRLVGDSISFECAISVAVFRGDKNIGVVKASAQQVFTYNTNHPFLGFTEAVGGTDIHVK